jgi:hypothetical protein
MPLGPSAARIIPLAAALAAVATACPASDRVRMAVDNVALIDVKDCMQTAAQAVADENLDAYVGCFTAKQRPELRRKAAMVFVKHEVDLELVDSHLVDKAERKAELAVMYRVRLSQQAYDVTSLIGLVREDEQWLIATEQVEGRSGARQRGLAAGSGEQAFRFGGGGDVVLNPQADGFLPADIGRAPGGGCANGRCGVPR